MSEQSNAENCKRGQGRKHKLGRRARFTIAAITLVAAGAVLGAAATAQAERMGHHWSGFNTEEQARERALDKAAWMLGRLDATAEQETQINAIVNSLVGELYGLRGAHREHRRQLIAELARPELDRDALEKIRVEELGLADAASKAVLNAVADASQVLSVEQREELAGMIARRRH
jgi:Spy/CpxP family protein refolding chaperone